ncbi:MAG: hypothetical protein CMH57_12660 [Myxococcales bacterium]|nr:hypothetical protein [Myxococcales bacterium]
MIEDAGRMKQQRPEGTDENPPSAKATGPWLTQKQAAERLGVSTRTVRRLAKTGGLHVEHIGRFPRYHCDDIDHALRSGALTHKLSGSALAPVSSTMEETNGQENETGTSARRRQASGRRSMETQGHRRHGPGHRKESQKGNAASRDPTLAGDRTPRRAASRTRRKRPEGADAYARRLQRAVDRAKGRDV